MINVGPDLFDNRIVSPSSSSALFPPKEIYMIIIQFEYNTNMCTTYKSGLDPIEVQPTLHVRNSLSKDLVSATRW